MQTKQPTVHRNLRVQIQWWWYTDILVYWCTGVLVYWYTDILVYWYTGVLVYWCTGILVYWYSGILVYWCTSLLVYWYSVVLVYCCTGILLYWYTGVLVYLCTCVWCTGVLVYWCTGVAWILSLLPGLVHHHTVTPQKEACSVLDYSSAVQLIIVQLSEVKCSAA